MLVLISRLRLFHKWEPAWGKHKHKQDDSAILNQFPDLLQRYCACVCLIFLCLFHMWEHRKFILVLMLVLIAQVGTRRERVRPLKHDVFQSLMLSPANNSLYGKTWPLYIFRDIPFEPNTANRHTETHIFHEFRPCTNNIVYARFEVFGTFLCILMSVFRVFVR